MAAMHAPREQLVKCVRCAVVYAHPYGSHPDRCQNCGRERSAV